MAAISALIFLGLILWAYGKSITETVEAEHGIVRKPKADGPLWRIWSTIDALIFGVLLIAFVGFLVVVLISVIVRSFM